MAKSRPVKLSKEEVANAIRREGIRDDLSSCQACEYWSVFGQRWRITHRSRWSNVITNIEQIDEEGNPISFKENAHDVD